MSIFTSDFFINNRLKLRALFTGTAPIILSANGLLQQNSDNTYPFRQDSSFWYFTGINEPGLILVLDKNKDYLILPNRSKFSDLADGAIDVEQIIESSGIDYVLEEQEGWKQLGDRLKRARHAAILPSPGAYIEAYGFFSNPARAKVHTKMKSYNANLEFLDIRTHVTKLRATKQDVEVEAIKNAVAITSKTIKKISRGIGKLENEYDVEALILSEFRSSGSKPAFNCIVAGGLNACTIHYNENSATLDRKDLLLIDIGADFENYAADISRTLSISKKPTKRQRQIFDSVKQVQDYAMSLIKPGCLLKDYEQEVEQFMGEQLRVLGLINAIDTKSVREFYPHSATHFLGLDPHDIGAYELPLTENMIVTVEPGIYVPNEGIGVRLEDDVIITPGGNINLSADLPSDLF